MSLADRLRGMVSRCVVNLVSDSLKLQGLQVTMMAEQTSDDVEHFQHYGFTSVARPGAEGIALAIGGSTGHTVVINVDDRRYRLKALQSGEVALYDDLGQKVHLTRSGIVVNGGGLPINITNAPSVTINSPQTTCTGALTVQGLLTYKAGLVGAGGAGNSTINGNVVIHGTTTMNNSLAVVGGAVTHNGVSIGDTHKHTGVQPGAGQTGNPV
jgi:phage baseplate assembly protein V